MPFWILFAALAVYGLFWIFRSRGSKEKTVRARITEKQTQPHRQQGKEDNSLLTDYIVRFNVQGKELALLVSRSAFESARVDAEGLLAYKGDVFIDFTPDNSLPW